MIPSFRVDLFQYLSYLFHVRVEVLLQFLYEQSILFELCQKVIVNPLHLLHPLHPRLHLHMFLLIPSNGLNSLFRTVQYLQAIQMIVQVIKLLLLLLVHLGHLQTLQRLLLAQHYL